MCLLIFIFTNLVFDTHIQKINFPFRAMTFRAVFICIPLLLLATMLRADPKISTSLNANQIGLDEILTVTYTATNAYDLVEHDLPRYQNFLQVGVSQSMENNETYTYTVMLQPQKVGTFQIPGLTIITSSGQKITSRPVTVKVVERRGQSAQNRPAQTPFGNIDRQLKQMDDQMTLMQLYSQLEIIKTYLSSGQLSKSDLDKLKKYRIEIEAAIKEIEQQYGPQRLRPQVPEQTSPDPESNFFVRAVPSKREAYVNEPIEITFKIFYATSFSNGEIKKLPQLSGFVTRDFPPNSRAKPSPEEYQGRMYNCIEVKKCIAYPTKAGKLQIDGLEISAFTDRFGRVTAISPVEVINVKPLPNTDRKNFTGAVGDFAISTVVSSERITTDDIGKLTFIVGGRGNFDIFSAPEAPTAVGPLSFVPPTTTTQTDSSDAIRGSKTFVYEFSATEAGHFEIPAMPFTYFNAETGTYTTLYTDPITIRVDEGQAIARGGDDTPEAKKNLLPAVAEMSGKKGPLAGSSLWLPIAMLAAFVAMPLMSTGRKVSEERKIQKAQEPEQIALQRLATAHSLMGNADSSLFFEEISKSIWLYLAERLEISASGLSKNQLQEKMQDFGLNDSLVQRVFGLIQDTEMALYARNESGLQKQQILQQATQIIGDLEKVFSQEKWQKK